MLVNANWITPSSDMGDCVAEFSRTFCLKRECVRASLTVTAIGVYDAYINGRRVGDFILAPGCTNYAKRLQYQTYDIKPMLEENNTITIGVGKGWHRSRMSEARPEINKKPCAIIAEVEILYPNGEIEHIISDESWRVRKSNVIFNDIWDGEICDARLNEKFGDVKNLNLDKSVLIPQEGEKVTEHERLKPIKVITTPKGEKVLDFGQEITGYVEVNIKAKSGDEIQLSCAEVFDKDGNFYNENYRSAKSTMKYICCDGEQTFKPRYTFYGFRYIRVDKYPGEINPESFTAIAVYSNMQRSGYIRTSNKKLNRFFENTLWSQRDNFLDIPTDCPQRDERMGWTGDAQVFAKTACYNYNAKKFYEKWLGDLRSEQLENGGIPDTAPNFWRIMRSSTAWGDAITVIPWQVYVSYGNKKVLEDNFEAMKKWVDYMTNDSKDKYLWTCSKDDKKLWGKHYGDWLGIDAPSGSYIGASDIDFISSTFYAYSTQLLIKAGRVLGKNMNEYEKLYENIVSTFKKVFNEPKTQTEHVLALHFGLANEPEKVAAELNRMVKENGNKLQTGFVGTPYLLYALSKNGYKETAYSLLFQEEYPSWLYEVNKGATTIWEHWDGIKEDGSFWSTDMNSYNHYAYGAAVDWMYSVMGGINADESNAGYERVIIEPKPTNRLEWFEAEYNCKYGKIVSKWTKEGDKFRYEITTPVRAVIIINEKKYEVESGSYLF